MPDVMTREGQAALVAGLDAGARVSWSSTGRLQVVSSDALTAEGLDALQAAVPDVQVNVSVGSGAWDCLAARLADLLATLPDDDE